MGLDRNAVRFLLKAKQSGVTFDSTLTLGRQWLILDEQEAESELRQLAPNWRAITRPDGFADDFLRAIGVKELHVMDVSDYEQAQIIHDLNEPIPDHLKGAYDVVIDGGTCEHVFNYPCAIRNCMEMVRVGGTLITCPPANNHCGHGFYQISPEAHYRVLCKENGFRIEQVVMFEWGRRQWYEVLDPQQVRARVELQSGSRPVVMMTRATRIAAVPIFHKWPQQIDYVAAWTKAEATQGHAYSKYVPEFLRPMIRKLYYKHFKQYWTFGDSRCFRKITSE
jgi:hypothetical protein